LGRKPHFIILIAFKVTH